MCMYYINVCNYILYSILHATRKANSVEQIQWFETVRWSRFVWHWFGGAWLG